jgi:ribonuclease J
MGQQRLSNVQGDDQAKRPNRPNQARPRTNNTILDHTTTGRGEAFRAQRRTNENVNMLASQHVINVPVNKSIYNGYKGQQFSPADHKKSLNSNGPKIRIIPIGGLGEMGIGKNMTAIEYGDDIIILDCGLLFPGNDYPGINYIVPDVTYLEENKHKIRAFIFTHGHLDHVGAYRHIAKKLPVPIYATRFTIGMLKRSMEESNDDYEPQYNELNPDIHERVQIGDNFNIELVRVDHSIPDCAAIIIRTPLGVLLDTGDWRFEEKPVDGKKMDMERLTEIATKEGILLMMNESTNCESNGSHNYGEFDIQENMGQIMSRYPNDRLIISCFSSQINRMQLILEEAKKFDRKVAFAGFSIIQNLEVALRAGVIKVPKDVVVKMEDIIKLPDGKVTIICTGSQGEFNAVLNHMANGSHKYIKIKNTDVIVFSSNPIPGNEKYVARTVDGLMREGSSVIQNGRSSLIGIGPLHLSGHAYHDEHVELINALNPKYYMPIHGEFHMLVRSAELAEKEAGVKRENIFVCDNGDVLEITTDGARKNGRVPVGGIMYDDSGQVVSEVVLKDRIHMSTEGIFVVVLTIQRGSGRLLTSPDIISRGFIYLRDSEELMGEIRQYLKQKVAQSFSGKHVDLDVIKKELKDEIAHILYDQTRRTPIVIPVINEIGGNNPNFQKQPSDYNKSSEHFYHASPKQIPERVVPDEGVAEPHVQSDNRSY